MAIHKEEPVDQRYRNILRKRIGLVFLSLILIFSWIRTHDVCTMSSTTTFPKLVKDSCITDGVEAVVGEDHNRTLSVKHIIMGNSSERKPPLYLTKASVHDSGCNPSTDSPNRAIRKNVIQYYTDMFFNRRKLDAHFQKTSAKTPNIVTPIVRNTIGALMWILCIAFFLSSQGKCSNKKYLYEKYYSTKISFLKGLNKNYEFVFELNGVPRTSVQIFPFSINQYVDEIVKQNRSGEDLMKFEWSRYLSFKTFPMDSVMTPMRLAQAGFFYTGQGQQVKCFCCGVTNGDWTTEETAVEVHKRLSPNCRFIHSEDTDNVEIHNKEYYNGMFDVTSHPTNARSASGASGGPSDAINNTLRTENNKSPASVQQNTGNGKEYSPKRNVGNGSCDSALAAAQAQKQPSSQAAANTVEPREPMKHPHYADVATRMATFTTWTLMDIQDPAEMAQAGFFYTGVSDFVRCYYCGVGLKNWERGDSPWAEHTHWSSSCPHLFNSRAAGDAMGDDQPRGSSSAESVKQTSSSRGWSDKNASGGSDKNASGGSDKNASGGSDNKASGGSDRNASGGSDKNASIGSDNKASGGSDNKASGGSDNKVSGGSDNKASGDLYKSTGASGSSDMDSDAARSLLDMGYSHEQVASAIQKFRDTNKSKPLHATALVELLEYHSSSEENASSASTATNSVSTTVPNSAPSSMLTVRNSTVEQSMANMSISNKERQVSPVREKQATTKHTGNNNGEASLLAEENRVLKSQMQCKICMDSEANVVFLPCGHMVACQTCAVNLRKCAVCRKIIKGSVHVYQS